MPTRASEFPPAKLRRKACSAVVKQPSQLMTIPELAEYLALPSDRLYKLARQAWGKDRFPASKIRGTWYVDPHEMLDWMFRLLDGNQVLTFSGGRVRREMTTRGFLESESRTLRRPAEESRRRGAVG